MKVVIALAHNYRAFDKPFAMSLFKMQRHFYENNGGELKIVYSEGLQLDEMREVAVRRAMSHEPDYVLLLDSDMDFPEDCILKMIKHLEEKKEYDAVCGMYCFRTEPYLPMMFKNWDEIKDTGCSFIDEIPEEPFDVDCTGLGIIMIRSSFIKQCKDRLFRKTGTQGEEMYFFSTHRPKLLCDPSIDCGHWNLERIDVKRFMKENNIKKYKGKIEVPFMLSAIFTDKLKPKKNNLIIK